MMKLSENPAVGQRRSVIPSAENAVEWLGLVGGPEGVEVGISRFTGAGGTMECHVTVALRGEAPEPADLLVSAWHAALAAAGIGPGSTVMRRLFSRDSLILTEALHAFRHDVPGAFSVVGQTPLAGGPLALWSQHVLDPEGPLQGTGGDSFSVVRGELRHCWRSGLVAENDADAFSETMEVLEKHEEWLDSQEMTLAENVVRTWWFVRDIDEDYTGLVAARRGHFAAHGLTESTHYIASTGIGGSRPQHPGARVSLDSYAIHGLQPAQVRYLSAPDHLGPTHAYGVTFERATSISFEDRRHVYLSGTASIDPAGNIVHPGDVSRQLDRTLENIAALLAAAKARPEDLAMILVYLRDPADGKKVETILRRKFPSLPMILLHAPVCRPGWLVEIEGIAMVDAANRHLPEF